MIHPEGRSLLPSPPASINAVSYPNPTRTQNSISRRASLGSHLAFPAPFTLTLQEATAQTQSYTAGFLTNPGKREEESSLAKRRLCYSWRSCQEQQQQLPRTDGPKAACTRTGRTRTHCRWAAAGGGFEKPTPQCSGLHPAADVVGRRGRCKSCPVSEPLGPKKEFNGIGGAKAGPLHG